MRRFKFLNDDDDNDLIIDEGYDGASWVYGRSENLTQYQYEIVRENYHGIHSFLSNFPPHYVVTILSIVGPNDRINNDYTEYDDGWGFDITNDLISIEWVRFIN